MFNFLKSLFGSSVDLADLIHNQGAVILDVRSKGEYKAGHVRGSVNVPLNTLTSSKKLPGDKNIPIVTCCASGRRSGIAKSQLKSMGYVQVQNGGGWQQLRSRLEKAAS